MLIELPPHQRPLNYAFYLLDDVSVCLVGQVVDSVGSDADVQVSLGSALFDFDSTTLNEMGQKELQKLLDSIPVANVSRAVITGHTDSTGTEEYNQRLSELRAGNVATYFIRKGIPKEIIETIAMGYRQPLGADPAANRRVEVKIWLGNE